MQITRTAPDTEIPPAERFTGAVYLDPMAAPPPPARLRAYSVHFAPGARTAWHSHPYGQILLVIEGAGYVQRRGGPIEVIQPGDRIWFEPEAEHWHGASRNRFMTHLAVHEAGDDGKEAAWGPLVTDEEYGARPAES